MSDRWDVEQAAFGWRVVRVTECTELGKQLGITIKPFRMVERRFWQFSSALRYATGRHETAHIQVMGGGL